jgi:hypothetical protein
MKDEELKNNLIIGFLRSLLLAYFLWVHFAQWISPFGNIVPSVLNGGRWQM